MEAGGRGRGGRVPTASAEINQKDGGKLPRRPRPFPEICGQLERAVRCHFCNAWQCPYTINVDVRIYAGDLFLTEAETTARAQCEARGRGPARNGAASSAAGGGNERAVREPWRAGADRTSAGTGE